jgi:Right handed beta helix region
MVTKRALGLGAICAAATSLWLPFLVQRSAEANERPQDRERKPVANRRHIGPVGSGNRSGTDWQNAAALLDINEMIRLAGPGGTVYLLAGADPFRITDPIVISRGGVSGEPVKIMGIDSTGAPAKARIIGTRTSPYPTTREDFAAMNRGTDVFRLKAGADHLHFSFLEFQNIGNGAFLVQANIAALTLEDIIATNVTRFFERDPDKMCTVTDLRVRRVSVDGFSKSAIRLDQNTSNVVIEDVRADSMRQDFDNFAEGVDLSGNVHDVIFRRCVMRNSQQTRGPDDFWNGDGFTTELGTHNILFEDCIADGNTDAGFDLKSNNLTLSRCRSYGNTANFKLWGKEKVVMHECVSENPIHHGGNQKPSHLSAPWGANVLVKNCRFTDQNRDVTVYHTEANDTVKPPVGSTITVTGSGVRSSGKLSFVDLNSKVFIDGVEQPFDGR